MRVGDRIRVWPAHVDPDRRVPRAPARGRRRRGARDLAGRPARLVSGYAPARALADKRRHDAKQPGSPLLGRLAVHLKMITMDQLAEAPRGQARSDRPRLGDVLVEMGFLTQAQLEKLVQAQAQVVAKQRSQAAARRRRRLPPRRCAGSAGGGSELDRDPARGIAKGASDVHLHAGAPSGCASRAGWSRWTGRARDGGDRADALSACSNARASSSRARRAGLLPRARGRRSLPRQRLPPAARSRRRVPLHPAAAAYARAARPAAPWRSSPPITRAWCSSPGPPAAARRRRSPRSST